MVEDKCYCSTFELHNHTWDFHFWNVRKLKNLHRDISFFLTTLGNCLNSCMLEALRLFQQKSWHIPYCNDRTRASLLTFELMCLSWSYRSKIGFIQSLGRSRTHDLGRYLSSLLLSSIKAININKKSCAYETTAFDYLLDLSNHFFIRIRKNSKCASCQIYTSYSTNNANKLQQQWD